MNTVALAGNPNCGKTTLFNALTGANQYVGNWPGVTVEKREAVFDIDDKRITLVDLPGAYSMEPYSIEERVTRDFLRAGDYQAIINIVDATNPARNLYLTYQLLALNKPMLVALNMMDELSKAGGAIDHIALSTALGGIPVIPLSAKKQTGFDELFTALNQLINVGNDLDRSATAHRADSSARIYTRARAQTHTPDAARVEIERYARINTALTRAKYVRRAAGRADITKKLDQVFTHKLFAFPIFLCVLGIIFYLAFGAPAQYLTRIAQYISLAARELIALAVARLPAWARSLALDGVWAGASGVICFLPQVLILFLCMSAIEDSGYMARAAFITDRLLRKLGLSGRSVIPMLMGLGCTTTAVAAARGVSDERDRRTTVMLTPCMSCGAKLPVYAAFARAFFAGNEFIVISSMYVMGAFALVLTGLFLRKRVFREGDTPFIMELPAYRLPVASVVRRRLGERARDFLKRAGTVIVVMSAAAWFFRYFTPALAPAGSIEESMLARAGEYISPLLTPLGFGGWDKAVGLISGLVAKESVLSTFQVIYIAPDAAALANSLRLSFESAWSAYGYMAFFLLYPPCVSAIAAMRRELNNRRQLLTILAIQLITAALASALIRAAGAIFG